MRFSLRSWFESIQQNWSWQNLNPLNWTNTEIKLFLISFLVIMLPIYLFIGFQPAPVADAAGYPQLEISSINLKTPVAEIKLDNRQLIAPATIAGVYKAAENKTFIIGHSSTVFKKLDQIKVNDTFTYDNHTYTVRELKTLLKSDIDMREILQPETNNTVIIMTCAGEPLPNQDATHRLIITATLTS